MLPENLDSKLTIAVDFDGTLVEHKYPKIGDEIPGAFDTLRKLINDGHKLILWTVREGHLLDEAVEYCAKQGVRFYAVNKDYPEERLSDNFYSRKLKVDLFIDDRNLGGLPPWEVIYEMITKEKQHDPYYSNEVNISKEHEEMMKHYQKKKKKGLGRFF